ncbi:aconitase/3-isopropylmalate dehydratase large subunit family protein [Gemmatimonadota bacterium]
MGQTVIEKIFAAHTGDPVTVGEIVELEVDARVARDFGGANVVANLEAHALSVDDPSRTWFTFDCNPTGSDQGYTANQHRCRLFARREGISVFDIDRGIGTHLAIEEGLARPGQTFVSTDSHANILGAISAFGQGMGDMDIASAFSRGSVWFKVPPTVRVIVEGTHSSTASAKDITLALVRHFGAKGLLGRAAEIEGEAIEALDLAGRITLASMATEMGAIILFPRPGEQTAEELTALTGIESIWPHPDDDADWLEEVVVDIEGLEPLVSLPGHPDDVVPLTDLEGTPIDSAFIGSCTNGRLEDLQAAAEILEGRTVADGIVLKIVPATDRTWMQALEGGLIEIFKKAGALVSNAGCAGCAAGQVGQTGTGEATVSTGNRNFPGKQGLGSVYLASPAVAATSAVTGMLTLPGHLDREISRRPQEVITSQSDRAPGAAAAADQITGGPSMIIEGRVWLLDIDSVDTDMIYHNRHLAVTDIAGMGAFALGNIPGWEMFPEQVEPGDILITGENFGAGSSRQQAVDCFRALGISAIIGASFGSIYERNAVNAGMPLLTADLREQVRTGERIRIDMETGVVDILERGERIDITPLSPVQSRIYRRGGLLSDG